jgi:hypothetical protein
MTMDFMKALQYPFEDEDWLKKLGIVLVAGLVAVFIPLLGLVGVIAILGWSLETTRNVKNNVPKPMASWDDIGGVIGKGVGPFLGGLVYQAPTILFICIAIGLWFASFGAAVGSGSDDAAGAFAGMGTLLFMCCICVTILYTIAASIVLAGGFIRYLDKPEFSTFMQFGDNLALIRNNISDFLMAFLYLLGGSVVSSILSWTIIGALVAIPFNVYFSSHIIGQLAAKLGSASAPRM